MSIEEKNINYLSHKHKYNVYVEINSKTKLGEDLLKQYHNQTKYQYMDVGRIGYHDEYGRYKLDFYTVQELMVVPKLILRVRNMAMDRAGRDVYELRTYMSKFGQLNFLLIVDRDKADLILVENIYIENLNHREDYETLLWRLSYYNQKPIPLAEIFYKFGIKANPDDYGRAWKVDGVKINNIIISLAKAEMTKQVANKVASEINQKVLLTSLNYLNKEGDYGKKITKAYSENVAKNNELNKLSSTPKLDNTLNQVLIKAIDTNTTKKDVRDKTNFKLYKKVIDTQLTCPLEIQKVVKQVDTKQNLKQFVAETYQNAKPSNDFKTDNAALFNAKQEDFERIIDCKFDKSPNEEASSVVEEKIDLKKIEDRTLPKEFRDFQNKVVEVNTDIHRFYKDEDQSKQKQREKEEFLNKKQREKEIKLAHKKYRQIKVLNAECDLDKEFERSKVVLGLAPNDSKKKRKKVLNQFFSEDKSDKKKKLKIKVLKNKKEDNHDKILQNLAKKIKKEESAKEDSGNIFNKKNKHLDKESLRQEKYAKKQDRKEKQKILKQQKLTKKQEDQEEKKRKRLLKMDLALSKTGKIKDRTEKHSRLITGENNKNDRKSIKHTVGKKLKANSKKMAQKNEEKSAYVAFRPIVKSSLKTDGAQRETEILSYAAQIKKEIEEKEQKKKSFVYDPVSVANNESKQGASFNGIKDSNLFDKSKVHIQSTSLKHLEKKKKEKELEM